ncbi:hypothetical protein Leryth_022433 [Lithospermum erythrorhizon]|nr:hypothetical protein Leryth_022433 [Lithospermum erythrorhizon]
MKKMNEKNLKEAAQLNPNWAQLLQKLNTNSYTKRVHQTILGKRKERSIEEPIAPKPNPLLPTSTDCRCNDVLQHQIATDPDILSFATAITLGRKGIEGAKKNITNVLAMDCEMVGVGPLGNKNALGRVTLVNKWGNVIYDEFVRPIEHVVNFRSEISGIRPSDLRKAKNFNVVQKKVAELIKGRILVGHALHNDLKALLLSHPKNDIRDTSEYQPLLKEGQRRGLRHLAAEILGVEIQNGEHCPVEDARAAMVLYQKYRKQWEKSVKDYIRLQKKQKKRGNKRKQPHEDGEKS